MNFIGILQETTVREKWNFPKYTTTSLPDSSGFFHTIVEVGEKKSRGCGTTKKESKREAAEKWLATFASEVNLTISCPTCNSRVSLGSITQSSTSDKHQKAESLFIETALREVTLDDKDT
jgi:hypothetical protein